MEDSTDDAEQLAAALGAEMGEVLARFCDEAWNSQVLSEDCILLAMISAACSTYLVSIASVKPKYLDLQTAALEFMDGYLKSNAERIANMEFDSINGLPLGGRQ